MTPRGLRARLRISLPALILAGVLSLSTSATANALTSPQATPPTPGALSGDGPTKRYLLGGEWLYQADPADTGIAAQWWRPSSRAAWASAVTVPNAFNNGDYSDSSAMGSVGWYRRDFTLPPGAFPAYVPTAERRWIIRFESVNYRATIWLNGRLIGRHTGTGLPFEFALSGLTNGVNHLIVRIDSRRGPLDLPPRQGGWWNFGGILREVYLRPVAGVDIADAEFTPRLPCPSCVATIAVSVRLRNLTGRPLAVQLSGRFGHSARFPVGTTTIPPGASSVAGATLRVIRPRLWTVGQPQLYRASLWLTDGKGRPLAEYITMTGIRQIAVNADGHLTINGRVVHLRGVEIREQDRVSGAALSPAQITQLVDWARLLGATLIRTDEPSPLLAELADRDGLLIWSEIPVSGLTPNQELTDPRWVAGAHALLRDNILTNRHHPSILLWSIGNELQAPANAQVRSYIAGAVALARRLDPTRPVGMAISDWPGMGCQSAYAPLQVIGVNEYFGWYSAGGGVTDDRDALGPYLDALRACYPHQALMISEFGFEATRDGPVEVRGTYQFQADAAAYHLRVFASKRWLSAAIYFLLQDAASQPHHSGGNPFPTPPFVNKGLIDLSGHEKLAFAVVAAIFRATAQLGSK